MVIMNIFHPITTLHYYYRMADIIILFLDKKYNVIYCTGYLKSWPPAKVGLEEQEGETDPDSCNIPCLVAFGRILPHISTVATAAQNYPVAKTIDFTSRHSLDGKFLFVDQR